VAWDENDDQASAATKMALTGVLLGSMLLFGRRSDEKKPLHVLSPLDLIMLGLASYRTGRIIAFERVAKPLREPFTETVPDGSGMGDTVVARGKGVRWALGELFSCPVCLATWVAAALLYSREIIPRPTRIYVGVMGIAGVAEIVFGISEALLWFAHAKRVDAGASLAAREAKQQRESEATAR
jgi:hypothetical protein